MMALCPCGDSHTVILTHTHTRQMVSTVSMSPQSSPLSGARTAPQRQRAARTAPQRQRAARTAFVAKQSSAAAQCGTAAAVPSRPYCPDGGTHPCSSSMWLGCSSSESSGGAGDAVAHSTTPLALSRTLASAARASLALEPPCAAHTLRCPLLCPTRAPAACPPLCLAALYADGRG